MTEIAEIKQAQAEAMRKVEEAVRKVDEAQRQAKELDQLIDLQNRTLMTGEQLRQHLKAVRLWLIIYFLMGMLWGAVLDRAWWPQ